MLKHISQCTDVIREHLNYGLVGKKVRTNKANWHELCNALDLVSDTDLAIYAYKGLSTGTKDGLEQIYVLI